MERLMSLLESLIGQVFVPPEPPPLGVYKLMPGLQTLIETAVKGAYFSGIRDGVIAGVLLAILLLPRLAGRGSK